ncbi:N-acetylmuramoyl-L-alanine amidase [Aureimonas populi]|uniref:N-acetylmuramoyl-L-alanine amidase n=1 Tax=Aureimonas populi TaxID=1701758 RepID=A0ABW5CKB7_9HYPH|nr:N-acetylmuramoyl-L-alanine amidase [Aureimonas populi]
MSLLDLRFCMFSRLIGPILALLLLAPGMARGQDAAIVTGFALSSTEGGATVRIEVQGEPEADILLLQAPNRIALDLSNTVAAVRPPTEGEGLVSALRDGLAGKDSYRIVFTLAEPALAEMTSSAEDGRTTIELAFERASAAQFAQAVRERAGQRRAASRAPSSTRQETLHTIVLDPGHGGRDYGAVGKGGTLEKELNLSFAIALREALEASPSVRVVMTREDDVLVPLAERAAMARREEADLFVSLHADSIRYPELRGASVYTLSDRASDSLAGELAESENASDRFLGEEWQQDTPEIHGILVDLVRRETEHLSQRFAGELVLELNRADIRLINNPKRSAGFRVLMAPDVPSVLLEMGYLSNADDEEMMKSADWQAKAAEAVAEAITGFLAARAALAGAP